jgi:hypothetical protein
MLYYSAMKKPKKPAEPTINYTVEQVWAAAAYAQRINGEFISAARSTIEKSSNRKIMDPALADSSLVTEEDTQLGQQALTWISRDLMTKALRNGQLSEWDQSISTVVGREDFTNGDRLALSIIASQISAYQKGLRAEAILARVNSTAGYVAPIGQSVTADVEVTKVVYSQQWNRHFISGITSEGQMILFAYKESQPEGTRLTIKGTVKAHRDNLTQLNRVKVLGDK